MVTGISKFLAACHACMSSVQECTHPNGKICVDLFIKAHLGTFKVEEERKKKKKKEKQFQECVEVLQLGNVIAGREISLPHKTVFTEVEVLACNVTST